MRLGGDGGIVKNGLAPMTLPLESSVHCAEPLANGNNLVFPRKSLYEKGYLRRLQYMNESELRYPPHCQAAVVAELDFLGINLHLKGFG